MTTPFELHELDAPQLREMVQSLRAKVEARDRELAFKQATIDKITHEMAVLKRLKFATKSEHFNAEQRNLIEEAVEADLEALAQALDKLTPEKNADGQQGRASCGKPSGYAQQWDGTADRTCGAEAQRSFP